jgi:hypothetical protein
LSDAAAHLSYKQVESYLDEKADEAERELIQNHLAVCSTCAEELNDITTFKATLTTPAPTLRTPIVSPPLWEMFGNFWRLSQLQYAAAVAVLLFVAVAVWLVWRSARVPQNEIATSFQTPAASPNINPTPQISPSVPNATQVVISLNDSGKQVTLDNKGNLAGLESLPSSYQQAVKTALTTQRITAPAALAAVHGKTGTLLGNIEKEISFSLLSPIGAIVRSNRPSFRWRPLAGATQYVVTVSDSSLKEVATSSTLHTTNWTPQHALKRGGTYSWQVVAMKDGQEIVSPAPPAPSAKFNILGSAEADELTRAERPSGNSHLTRGVLYARAGLVEDAEREFRALLKANPKSVLAQTLLQQVRALK